MSLIVLLARSRFLALRSEVISFRSSSLNGAFLIPIQVIRGPGSTAVFGRTPEPDDLTSCTI
jgi:hypothetical protein